MNSTQVVVVGAGPGGYAAAFLAADVGLSVALVDPEANPGGVCVYRGCIPSKALLHVAQLLGEARHAKAWGVDFGEPRVDLAKLRDFKNSHCARSPRHSDIASRGWRRLHRSGARVRLRHAWQ